MGSCVLDSVDARAKEHCYHEKDRRCVKGVLNFAAEGYLGERVWVNLIGVSCLFHLLHKAHV